MKDLDIIKKNYGESMMRFCRSNFPTIIDESGLLANIFAQRFYPYRYLLEDIKKQNKENAFVDYIYACYENLKEDKKVEYNSNKTPNELMEIAGYTLTYCENYNDILKFEKYYYSNEMLCTFYEMSDRLSNYYIWFAIKKNVNEIKRSGTPDRQDEYGTSVISIQISRRNNRYISIKNRYNDTVDNADATFNNNLDNIIEGLTNSFVKKFNLGIKEIVGNFELMGYVFGPDGKYYKYNNEIDAVYYCVDNIVIKNGEIFQYEKEKYILMNNYLISLIDKKMYDVSQKNININELFNNINSIKVTNILSDTGEKIKEIKFFEESFEKLNTILINKDNVIIEVDFPNIEIINDNFMFDCRLVKNLKMGNVISIGKNFLAKNEVLESLYLPKVETIKSDFLCLNDRLNKLDLVNLKSIEDSFLEKNTKLKILNIPNVETIGNNFLRNNEYVVELYLPSLEVIGDDFIMSGNLEKIYIPKVKKIGKKFLYSNVTLNSICWNDIESIESNALVINNYITELFMPKIKSIGSNFLENNRVVDKLEMPLLEIVGDNFLENNRKLSTLEFNELKYVGNSFMAYSNLTAISCPKLEKENDTFLSRAIFLEYVDVRSLKETGFCFLSDNPNLKYVNLDSVEEIGRCTLSNNNHITTLYLPNVKNVKSGAFNANVIKSLYVPDISLLPDNIQHLCVEINESTNERRL